MLRAVHIWNISMGQRYSIERTSTAEKSRDGNKLQRIKNE
jgi:hypothetical protein